VTHSLFYTPSNCLQWRHVAKNRPRLFSRANHNFRVEQCDRNHGAINAKCIGKFATCRTWYKWWDFAWLLLSDYYWVCFFFFLAFSLDEYYWVLTLFLIFYYLFIDMDGFVRTKAETDRCCVCVCLIESAKAE